MIAVSEKYRQQLANGNRNYLVRANITLNDNADPAQRTVFRLTNEHIWEQGVVLTNSISSDNSFDIGAAIIGNLTLVLDNISGNFDGYDFINAKVDLFMGVTGDTTAGGNQIYYRIGLYVVDDTEYNGSLITLDCLDYMTYFDIPFSNVTGVSYPISAGQLVTRICSAVGVTLGNVFPNYNTQISAESGAWLTSNNVNCREVLQYIAQKCCCYCKINTVGQLYLNWYDKSSVEDYDGGTFNTTTTPYSDGDELDGGNFNDYDSGDSADGGSFTDSTDRAWLSQNYEMNVSVDEIVVTGCRVVSNNGEDDKNYDELYVDSTLERDHERYVLVIENNPLITKSEAASVANNIGNILAGLQIRAFTSRSLSDISYETGDMVTIVDFRGSIYYTWITSFTFTTNNSENFSCGAQSIRQRSETRYSQSAKTLVEANQNASDMLNAYDTAVKAMNDLAQSAIGYNKWQYDSGTGTITWLYNGSQRTGTDAEPLFPNSSVVFKISGDGVFISNDGGVTYTQGYDANSGTAILSLIYAVGLNAGWINTGTLTVGGTSNTDGKIDVFDANNNLIGQWSKNGLQSKTLTTKSGATYQQGLEIKSGSLNYLPPENSIGEAHITMSARTTSGSTANMDIYANNDINIEAEEDVTIMTQSGGIYFDCSTLHITPPDQSVYYTAVTDEFEFVDPYGNTKTMVFKNGILTSVL